MLAVLLPTLGLGAAAAWQAARAYRAAFADKLRDTARALATALDAEIGAQLDTLVALVASPDLVRGDLTAFHRHARPVAEALGMRIGVLGPPPDFRVLLDTSVPLGERLPAAPMAGRPGSAVARAFETGQPAVSNLAASVIPGRPAVDMVVPVLRDGRPVLAVWTALAAERLARPLEAQRLEEGAFASFVDADGVVVARSVGRESFVGRQVPAWYREAIQGQQRAVMRGAGIDGREMIVAFDRPKLALGWTVTVAGPLAIYEAGWQRPMLGLALGGALALAAGAALAFRLARRLLRPVAALARHAEAVAAAGSTSVPVPPPPVPVAEFETLRRSLARAEATLRADERRYRALAEAGTQVIWRVDPAGQIVEAFGWEALTGQPEPESLGQGWLQMIYPEDRAAVLAALAEGITNPRPVEVEARVRSRGAAGEEVWRWMLGRGVPVRGDGPDAPVADWIGTIRDVHQRRMTEAALAESEERFRTLFDAAPVGVAVIDPETLAFIAVNERATALLGYSREEFASLRLPDIEAAMTEEEMRAAARARAAGALPAEFETRHRTRSGAVRDVLVRTAMIRLGGREVRYSAWIDITQRKQAEALQRLLAREVDHRAKNALAVVQSVVRLTRAEDPRDFVRALEGRIAALSRAHSLLAAAGWAGAELRALAEAELAAFVDRVELDGPPVQVAPAAVQSVAMVLHELATNAAKHGALSVPEGRVSVRWTMEAGAEGAFQLRWAERGGPPVGGAPGRQGFGMKLLDVTVRRQLGGVIALDWDPAGLICDIAVPAARLRGNAARPAIPP